MVWYDCGPQVFSLRKIWLWLKAFVGSSSVSGRVIERLPVCGPQILLQHNLLLISWYWYYEILDLELEVRPVPEHLDCVLLFIVYAII